MPSLDVLLLQHAACEPPGAFEDELRAQGARLLRVEADAGDDLPADPREFDALVVMGGPMSVDDRVRLPWLAVEFGFLRRAVDHDVPVWGVCLGAQLLAAVLGAEVRTGPAPEVGLFPVRLTAEALDDRVFAGTPQELVALHWHGDTYDLPIGAVRLAGSAAYRQQAFRHRRSYGLQFHLEAGADLVGDWLELAEYRRSLAGAVPRLTVEELLAQLSEHEERMGDHARRLLRHWLTEVAGRPRNDGPWPSAGRTTADFLPGGS